MKMNTYLVQQDIFTDIAILYYQAIHSKREEAVIYLDQILFAD